jgi:hypothetical protein
LIKIITIGDTKFLALKGEKNEIINVVQISEIKEIHIGKNAVKLLLRNDDVYREAYDEANLDLAKFISDLLEQQ